MRKFLQVVARFAAPCLLLAAAFGGVFYGDLLPPSLAGLKEFGPYLALAVGMALAIAFNRGRALLVLITLALAYWAGRRWLHAGLGTPEARAVYVMLSVFAPINIALFAVLQERGIFNRHVLARLAPIVAEVALTAWIVATARADVLDWAWRGFLPFRFGIGALPQASAAVAAIALLVTLGTAVVSRSAVSASCVGAIVAFVVSTHVPAASWTFAVFTTSAALMLIIAVLHDAFQMAFRDELTDIASRRALNERFSALPRQYAIAMIDLDHFKQFNDIWGHETGDHVLKMVAAQIAAIGGGGTAYRYGGEEFVVVFPRKGIAEAMPYLEELRRKIQGYQLALRAPDRPPIATRTLRRPGGWKGKVSASITVSIGVAERTGDADEPAAVLDAADRAMYRAKDEGRNRVCR